MSSKWTEVANWQDPEYRWVTAKQDEEAFNGFEQAAAYYKEMYGKDVDPRWMDFDIQRNKSKYGNLLNTGILNASQNPLLKSMWYTPEEVDSSLLNWYEQAQAGHSNAAAAAMFSKDYAAAHKPYSRAQFSSGDSRNQFGPNLSGIFGGAINRTPNNPYMVNNSNNGNVLTKYGQAVKNSPSMGYLQSLGYKSQIPQTVNWQGSSISDKNKYLWDPNYYDNPELTSYVDSPNYSFYVRNNGGKPITTGSQDNRSWELGGELSKDAVASWFAKQGADPASYGTYSRYENTSDPLIQKMFFNKDGVENSYYYTPYDYAISGVGGTDMNGHMANQDLSFWNPSSFYTPNMNFSSTASNPYGLKSSTNGGFLTSADPTANGSKNLGSEAVRIRHRLQQSDSGLFGGGIMGSLIKAGISSFIPGSSLVFTAASVADALDKPNISKDNIFYGYGGPDKQPTFNFGNNSTTNPGTTPPSGSAGNNNNPWNGQTYRWNDVDYQVRNGGSNKYSLYNPQGQLAWNQQGDQGTTGLGDSFTSYLGTL